MNTSSRQLEEDVLQTSFEDIWKTFWKRVEDVLRRRLEDVCGRRTTNTSWRTLGRQKIVMLTTSSRRLEDILENQRCLLRRGRLRQRVLCQVLVGLPKINLLLFCGSIEKCLSGTIICLELDGGAGKYTKKTEIKLSKINFPILWWLLSPLPYTPKIFFWCLSWRSTRVTDLEKVLRLVEFKRVSDKV